ncbi:glycosyltransferase family 4 protein [Raoultella planticola]|nr:glycosyltransferase family 4 protein [Raoultella planticola]
MANRVFIFTRSLPFHHIGGMEVVAWDLAQALARAGYDVKVITTELSMDVDLCDKVNPKIHVIKNSIPGKYSNSWWVGTRDFIDHEMDENVKAIISVSAAGFNSLHVKKNYPQVKCIMQAHGTSWGEFISKWKKPTIKKCLSSLGNVRGYIKDAFFYNKFDFIVAIGPAVECSLKSVPTSFICNSNKVVKIENGIDESMFLYDESKRKIERRALGIDDDALVCISVSRLHNQKGVDNNIYSFKKLLDLYSNSYYIVCGEGNEEGELKKIVKDLNIEEKVIFVGGVSREKISSLMSSADIFIFLTKRVEGLPLNVLEAMSSGLSMVISEHLTFEQSEKVILVNSHDIDLASSSIYNLFINNKSHDRTSYIEDKNTLHSSILKYNALFKNKMIN